MNKPVLEIYHLILTALPNVITSYLQMKKLRLRLTNLPKVIQLVSGTPGFVPKSSKFKVILLTGSVRGQSGNRNHTSFFLFLIEIIYVTTVN